MSDEGKACQERYTSQHLFELKPLEKPKMVDFISYQEDRRAQNDCISKEIDRLMYIC